MTARLASSTAALATLLTLALPGTRARAYEDQYTLSVDAGYAAVLANPDLPTHGIQVGIGASLGLTAGWSLRGRLAYAAHPASETLHVASVGAEVYYVLDILRFVPFVGIGIDGIGTIQSGAFGADLGLHAVLGLDWLVSRDVLVGLDVRPYVLPFSLAENGIDPVYLTVDIRVALVFDR